jgi:predicted DCC family thiol-disulfide oxidoreductase YuxK
MIYLSARDTSGRLGFVDVRQNSALDSLEGVSCETALANIHAKTSDGQTLVGVAAFQVAYGLVGLSTLSKLLGIKALQPIFKYAYSMFAKHRFTLSRLLGGAALTIVKKITKKENI